ncbi:MAG: nuclear transport factor 2 family protein [Steroidobacteraceae bacterium]
MGHQEDISALSNRFLSALERGDPDEVRAFYTSDARIWHNFDDVAQTVEENMKLLGWMSRKLPQRHYRIIRREILSDGWLQQHALEATLPDGSPFRMLACCVVTVRDGLISRLDEYLDPAQAAPLKNL